MYSEYVKKNFAIGGGKIADWIVGKKKDISPLIDNSRKRAVESWYWKDSWNKILNNKLVLDDIKKGLTSPSTFVKDISDHNKGASDYYADKASEASEHNAKHRYVEALGDVGIATAGLYGIYKLYKYLKNKKDRTPAEDQKMQELKGKIDSAKR